VEVASYAEYARFSKRLRNLGFSEDSSEGAPICRWLIDRMKLDVMPTDETILGSRTAGTSQLLKLPPSSRSTGLS